MSIFKKIRNMYRVLSLLAECHQTHINLPVLGSAESLYRKYSCSIPRQADIPKVLFSAFAR